MIRCRCFQRRCSRMTKFLQTLKFIRATNWSVWDIRSDKKPMKLDSPCYEVEKLLRTHCCLHQKRKRFCLMSESSKETVVVQSILFSQTVGPRMAGVS